MSEFISPVRIAEYVERGSDVLTDREARGCLARLAENRPMFAATVGELAAERGLTRARRTEAALSEIASEVLRLSEEARELHRDLGHDEPSGPVDPERLELFRQAKKIERDRGVSFSEALHVATHGDDEPPPSGAVDAGRQRQLARAKEIAADTGISFTEAASIAGRESLNARDDRLPPGLDRDKPDRAELDRRARELAKKEGIPYIEAVSRLQRGG